jgi:hypothetical protein
VLRAGRGPHRTALLGLAVVALLVVALGAVVLARGGGPYTSRAVLAVDQPSVVRAGGDLGTIPKLVQLRGRLVAVAPTATVAGPAAERLGIDRAELTADLDVTAPEASLLVVVAARAGSAGDARDRAAAVSEELVAYLQETQARGGVAEEDRIVLVPVADARDGTRSDEDRKRNLVVGGAALSVLVAGAALWWWPWRDTTA